MTAFEVYKEYIALKNHFTKTTYDYFRYFGKTRLSFDKFETRNDKLFFQKLAKHPDPKNFLLSNLLVNEKAWIRDIAYSDAAGKVYQEWVKRTESLSYIFSSDLSKLDDDFNSNFIIKNNSHPKLLKLYMSGEITLESMVMLVDMAKCMKYWNSKLEYDPIWEQVSTKIVKYRPFLSYDKEKIKNIVLAKFDAS